jgi:CubicO group peptidase (beta-lactamase class C family)
MKNSTMLCSQEPQIATGPVACEELPLRGLTSLLRLEEPLALAGAALPSCRIRLTARHASEGLLCRRSVLALTVSGLIGGLSRTAAAQAPSVQPQPQVQAHGLDGLDTWLEAQRLAWRVPGMAVALIQEGRVAYVKGFGHRDAQLSKPVTTDTLFRAGSTTKALAAATVALLVDEGKLSWDEPVTTWLPELRLAGGYEYRSLSLRDMLSHRTGLPRHELLWYNNQTLTRQGLVTRLGHLPMSAPLRARYQYTNLMFVLAAVVVERVTGQTWEAFTQARLLAPLGMSRANLSALDMARDADHAVGHESPSLAQRHAVPLRHDPLLGPAGALNVSIAAYVRWAQLQLGVGQWEGRRLISTASMAAMWEPTIPVSTTPGIPSFDRAFYGLGWRIDRYRDTVRVAHGGDLNGFTSRVVLLPQKQLALVVLVNHGSHPLPNAVTPDLLDRMLGLAPENHASKALVRRDAEQLQAQQPSARAASTAAAGGQPSRALAAWAGTYAHPGYGELVVTLAADGLLIRFNDMPGTLQHLQFDAFVVRASERQHEEFGGLKLQFLNDLSGKVSGLQAAMDPNVAPIFFARLA